MVAILLFLIHRLQVPVEMLSSVHARKQKQQNFDVIMICTLFALCVHVKYEPASVGHFPSAYCLII